MKMVPRLKSGNEYRPHDLKILQPRSVSKFRGHFVIIQNCANADGILDIVY